jgi:methyl-accepting chemotaxis protein
MALLSKVKIGTKLIVTVGILIVAAVTAISVIIGTNVSRQAKADAERISRQTAFHYAENARGELNEAMNAARSLADFFGTFAADEAVEVSREEGNRVLADFIEANPQFLGVYVGFEPEAYDGRDAEYRGASGHDETGRYVPYFTLNEEGKAVVEPLLDYETAGAGDYYQLPKQRGRETVLDPFLYPVQGVEVLLTSLVVPIFNGEGGFLGIAGIDLRLDDLQGILADVVLYESGYLNLFSDDGTLIASKAGAEELIGDNIRNLTETRDYIDGVLSDEEFTLVHTSTVTGNSVLVNGVPIEIGNTGTYWSVAANITESEILADARRLIVLIALTGIAAVILTVGVLLLIARSISKPLSGAVRITDTIARGDLTGRIEVESRDEVGMLLKAMGTMKEALTGIVTDVKSAADQVGSGSQQMSSTAQELSQGASEQASSIEEVSSSMEEMTSNINQNADNATETERIAQQAARDAEEGGKAVVDAVAAMKKIAERIGIIEEIARQTNMLSLNASIEAARAGEHGKGFAVVAAEVGKLASRSKDAAGEISELSSTTGDLAERAQQMLDKLVPDIRKTAELVQEIGASSREQSTGAGQISTALTQLDTVIQQNASASEEMASVSEELAAQAQQLQATMEFFTIGGGRGRERNGAGKKAALTESTGPSDSEETGITLADYSRRGPAGNGTGTRFLKPHEGDNTPDNP